MAKKYDKEALLADFKTGGYTQRELAHRHGISPALVNKLTKGVSKDFAEVVNAEVFVQSTLAAKSEQEVNAVNTVVHREVNKRLKAEKIDDYLDNAVGIAAKKAVELLEREDVSMMEVEQFSKAQNNMRVGIGTQQKFAATVINNTNAQKTDNTLVVERI